LESAFAAPVTHQDQDRFESYLLQNDPPRPRRARKSSVPCHVQVIFQVSWLLATLHLAHDMGSKDADDSIGAGWNGFPIKPRGFANPFTGCRSSQFVKGT